MAVIDDIANPKLILSHQDTETFLSSVSSICSYVEIDSILPGLTAFTPRDAAWGGHLQALANLLNWAYGCRHADGEGQTKRGAPSAGGRYPTEIVVIAFADRAWRVLHYDFAGCRFLEHAAADAGTKAAEHAGLRAGDMLVCLCSLSWRTVQRYGVRGYRYCLVDAACVGSNLFELALDASGEARPLSGAERRDLSHALDLPPNMLLLAGLVITLNDGSAVPAWTGGPVSGRTTQALFSEEVPLLDPKMQRVIQLHQAALSDNPDQRLSYTSVTRAGRGVFDWAAARHSAREFDGRPLDRPALDGLAGVLRRWLDAEAAADGIALTAMIFERNGDPTGSARLLAAGQPEQRLDLPRPLTMPELARDVFQNQTIVANCAAVAVIGVTDGPARLRSAGDFVTLSWLTGCGLADLHRYATLSDLACTIVGGFSDGALIRSFGHKDFFPLLAFSYGNDSSSPLKVDSEPWIPLVK